jgi:hypothetical protein
MSQNLNSAVAVIGIDIGKNSFHVVGLDDRGAIVLRQKWSRGQIEERLANLPPCLSGMEACVGAPHLSRKLKAFGHDARLMPAKYVRPYSKGQKNDFRDAEAIAEAVQRPTMKFVATKTAEQLDRMGPAEPIHMRRHGSPYPRAVSAHQIAPWHLTGGRDSFAVTASALMRRRDKSESVAQAAPRAQQHRQPAGVHPSLRGRRWCGLRFNGDWD